MTNMHSMYKFASAFNSELPSLGGEEDAHGMDTSNGMD